MWSNWLSADSRIRPNYPSAPPELSSWSMIVSSCAMEQSSLGKRTFPPWFINSLPQFRQLYTMASQTKEGYKNPSKFITSADYPGVY